MGRPRKSTKTSTSSESKTKVHDFKVELPETVSLSVNEAEKLEGYVYEEKGRFWTDGKEFLCVRLLEPISKL